MSYAEHQEQLLREEIASAVAAGKQYYAKRQRKMARKGGMLSEADMQIRFIEWCRSQALRDPKRQVLRLFYHIPNGELRAHRVDAKGRRYSPTGRKLVAMGVRAGIPDLHLPVAGSGRFSLYIECKLPSGTLSPEQAVVHEELRSWGNWVATCRSLDDMKDTTCEYLELGDWREWEEL